MDKVFSKENKTLKKYWKIGKNTGKVREKSGNFVSPEKWEPCHCKPETKLGNGIEASPNPNQKISHVGTSPCFRQFRAVFEKSKG